MQLLPDDQRFLQRALELGKDAAAFASPNPTVGCVLTRNGEIIGEGSHIYENYDHAEVVALKQAQASAFSTIDATAYVTLEPCAHHGRTGPCAVALREAGISRCIVATSDPNPQVSGKGIQILRDGGVIVDVVDPSSALNISARSLNDAFAFSIQQGRPFVTLKSAVSIDGYLAPPPSSRKAHEPLWLTGTAARTDAQQLRHQSDAILTGVGTVLADNPFLTDRTERKRRRPLLRVILDSQLRTPVNSAIVQRANKDVLIFASNTAPEQAVEELEANGVEVVRLPNAGGRIDLNAALQNLHERNIRSALLEAGSALNEAFLTADLVDKVVLFFSDVELGHGSIPFAGHVLSPYALQEKLTSTNRQSFPHAELSQREDVKIEGYLHDPWSFAESST